MKKKSFKLDDWQEEILKTKGNICVRSGRQVGKSTIIAIKAAEYAVNNKNKTILVIAAVERQSQLLLEKILSYLVDNYKSQIKKGKYKPTKHKIHLINGSVIHCVPTGLTGYGIRGFTVDMLIADEAAFIPEDVWTAVTPMLAVTKGSIILLSTPHGKEGYYYRCFSDPNFKSFHISSEDCPRIDKKFLQREKERMTRVQYTQEYLGEFVDELMQFFPTDVIKKCMVLQKNSVPYKPHLQDSFLGVDVAGMGGDENVLLSVFRDKDNLIMFDMQIEVRTLLTRVTELILLKDRQYRYKKIYIDDGGLGVGVFDALLENEQTRRKVVAINNASRAIDYDTRRKRLLKEDLYNNLLRLMENGKIKLFDSPEVFFSLKSIQYNYDENKKLKIYGNYSHICEALVRAAWCVRDKSLNIYIY